MQVNGRYRKGKNQLRDIDLHRDAMVGQGVGSTKLWVLAGKMALGADHVDMSESSFLRLGQLEAGWVVE